MDSGPWGVLDEVSMQVLAAASGGPVSARRIADAYDIPRSTLYRRLEELVSLGVLRERSELDEKNNHYRVYESAVRELRISFENGETELAAELDDGRRYVWRRSAQ